MSLTRRPCKSVSLWCCKQTPLPTPTVTVTPTVTQTSTPTFELTSTPTPTNTLTPTVTQTPTGTPGGTPTGTPTLTPTNTLTPTFTPTNTLTPTFTPTNTLTGTIEPTPTSTPTQTVTPTTLCCYQYEVTNYYTTSKIVYYTDCDGTPSSVSCAGNGLQTYINCALEGSVFTNDIVCDNSSSNCITWNEANTPCGGCVPPTQTPTNTPTETSTPTLTHTNTLEPTNTPTITQTPTITPTSTGIPPLSCGNSYNGFYSPLTSSVQQVNLDLTSTLNGSTINLQFDAISRPNRFNIYDSVSGLIYTSGWIGSTSSVPGPWNPPGTTPANTSFTYNSSRTYYILVDIAADSISDSYTINLTCTPPPTSTPTPSITPTTTPTSTVTPSAVVSYSFCMGYNSTDCATACSDYNNCLN